MGDQVMARGFGVVLCAILVWSTIGLSALAQKGNNSGIMVSPEQQDAQLKALTNAVGLTSDQVKRVREINDDAIKRILEVRLSGIDPTTAGSKIKTIRKEQRTDIEELLSSEQKPKYEEYLAARTHTVQ